MNPSTCGYLLVALAACLWGTLGLLFRLLHDLGLPALTIAFLRAGIASVILLAAIVLARPALLKISRRAVAYYAIYGLCGVAAFYLFFTQATIQIGVTTTAVLLYTAPAFVTLIAWRAWGEALNARKLGALAFAFIGCTLVARAYDPAQLRLNGVGVALGFAAGFTYALYTVFSKFAVALHSPWTALTYALLFGALFLAPLQTPEGLAPLAREPRAWILLLTLALGPTLGALMLYNAGLRTVPASNASLIATLEPVVASILAFLILGERIEFLQIVGGGMVIGGTAWLNARRQENK
jgi:drug/metabolite transporter (DMT)-like permease